MSIFHSNQYKIKVGFAPTRRLVSNKEEAKKQKIIIQNKLRSWNVDFINLDWLNNEGFLYNIADAYKIACKFK